MEYGSVIVVVEKQGHVYCGKKHPIGIVCSTLFQDNKIKYEWMKVSSENQLIPKSVHSTTNSCTQLSEKDPTFWVTVSKLIDT